MKIIVYTIWAVILVLATIIIVAALGPIGFVILLMDYFLRQHQLRNRKSLSLDYHVDDTIDSIIELSFIVVVASAIVWWIYIIYVLTGGFAS